MMDKHRTCTRVYANDLWTPMLPISGKDYNLYGDDTVKRAKYHNLLPSKLLIYNPW